MEDSKIRVKELIVTFTKGKIDMINKKDAIERLGGLLDKELTKESLHEALFCEDKHMKVLRRFHLGKQSYVEYKIKDQSYADILILGNPNTFRLGIEERDGKLIVNSSPTISYSYL